MTPSYKSIPVKITLAEPKVPSEADELVVRRDGVAGVF
jgi:formylmethanofuran dehydrogenase subunit D